MNADSTVDFYSVTPETVNDEDPTGATFPARLAATARHAEANGFRGILVPHNMHEIDPWMVAGQLGASGTTLRPLIAVQPSALPPHTAAQAAAAYAALHGRPLDFNLVAGANPTELRSVGDTASKDERYDRLRSWTKILRRLLVGETVDWEDDHFRYRGLTLRPCPAVLTQCRFFMAGSSATSQAVAVEVADVAVTHPLPFEEWSATTLTSLRGAGFVGELGIRIGVLARDTAEAAWEVAHARFPRTWTGDQETKLKRISTNSWSRQLALKALAHDDGSDIKPEADGVYWLGAFVNGGATAPLLVGCYDDVAAALERYRCAGVAHVILTGISEDDYPHTRRVLEILQAG